VTKSKIIGDQIFSGLSVPKIIKISSFFTSVIQKCKTVNFLDHNVY